MALQSPTLPQARESGKKNSFSNGFRNAIAGGISASLSSVILQPLDVIRTRQQLLSTDGTQQKYKNIWVSTKNLYETEGMASLWRGSGPTIWRVLPGGALYFALLRWISETLRASDKNGKLSSYSAVVAGASARALAGALLHPVSVCKTRFEAYSSNNKASVGNSTPATLALIFRTEGIKGLFRGLGPTLMRDVPYSGLHFGVYSTTKDRLASLPDPFRYLVSATIAGFAATALTHPFDVLRTRLQTNREYKSSFHVMGNIWAQEGLATFTRGFWARMIRRTVSSALTWTSYETILNFLKVLSGD